MNADERFEQGCQLALAIVDWAKAQGYDDRILCIAFMQLASGAMERGFGAAAADAFDAAVTDLIKSHRAQAKEDAKFWNLMAEKHYDRPVRF